MNTATTVQTRRPPALHRTHTSPPRAPGRRVVAARSRLAWMWDCVQEDHPGERGSRLPRMWTRLAHDNSPGQQALIQEQVGEQSRRELASTGPWLPRRQERPTVMPLVPVLWPCGGRGFVPPTYCLIRSDSAQVF